MDKAFVLAAIALLAAIGISPASAKILQRGVPSNGVYWAQEKNIFHVTYYECFDQKTNRKVKQQQCVDAKAVKPMGTAK